MGCKEQLESKLALNHAYVHTCSTRTCSIHNTMCVACTWTYVRVTRVLGKIVLLRQNFGKAKAGNACNSSSVPPKGGFG